MAPLSKKIVARTFGLVAADVWRSLVNHQNGIALWFLRDPKPFLSPDSGLTETQRCNIFNFAMSLAGVGLKMPKGRSGKGKVWDDAVYQRGVELAKDRSPMLSQWVQQTYTPLVAPQKSPRRSFRDALVALAIEGHITGAPVKELSAEGEAGRTAAKEWFDREMNGLVYHKTTNPKGTFARTRSFAIALRAELTPRKSGGTGRSAAQELEAQDYESAEREAADEAEQEGEEKEW